MITNQQFREMALSFPGAIELPHFERTSFRVNKKIFATLDEKTSIATMMFSEIDQSVFCLIDKSAIYPVPNKWGQRGATYIELKKLEEDIVYDALNTSYNQVLKPKSKK